jgi:hypothetical protein
VVVLVQEYHVLLRSALRVRPHLRGCLVRCRDCRIFFPTHPRNAGRRDLRCPFGCRRAHQKRSSTQRSVGYYRTKEGRFKKRMQNGRRKRQGMAARKEGQTHRAALPAVGYDAAILDHVRVVMSLIEGRKVSRQEVVEMLERGKKRQQGIPTEEDPDYPARERTENSS